MQSFSIRIPNIDSIVGNAGEPLQFSGDVEEVEEHDMDAERLPQSEGVYSGLTCPPDRDLEREGGSGAEGESEVIVVGRSITS